MTWKPEPIPFKPNAMLGDEPVMVLGEGGTAAFVSGAGGHRWIASCRLRPLSRKVTKYVVCKKEPCDDNDWFAVATCKSKQHAMEYLRDLSPASYVIKPITIDMNEFEAEPDWDEPPGG